MDKNTKRLAILSVSSLLLVAMIVAVTISVISNESSGETDISTSNKAIKTLCTSVDYQDTCVKSLSSMEYNKTDDPKELVKIGFQVTMKEIKAALNKSVTLQKLEQDPRSKEALKSCSDLATMSMKDLERSFTKFVDLDITQLNEILGDLKIWLSGAMTYEETCLDSFQNTTGEAGEKMKSALKFGMQMTTNALAMVTEIATAFVSIAGTPPVNSRRLLSFPDWLDPVRRGLDETKPEMIEADIVVAQDGSGKFKTINEALKHIPKSNTKTFVLHIKEGIYEEKVEILSSMKHLMIIGDGPNKTKITGKLNYVDGITTYHTATVAVHGDYFIAKDIGFENTAGAVKEQAVALRVSADKSIFYNCRIDGYQDTLYTHTYRQFYRDCVISGTIDFVFGDAAVVFQNCTFLVRKPLENQRCIVTAQGRKHVRQPTAIVLQNCTITADTSLESEKNSVQTYLARPWKEYSRTIIMESYIDDVIQAEGYLPWNDTFAFNTLFYTEFNNRGPRSSKDKRVKWPGIKELTTERIKSFTSAPFIDADLWIPPTKVPYAPGLIQPPPSKEPVAASPISLEEDVYFNVTDSQQQNDLRSELKSSAFNRSSSKTPTSNTGSDSTSDSKSDDSSTSGGFDSTPASDSSSTPSSNLFSDSTSASVLAPASNLIPTSTSASVLPPASASTPASVSLLVPPSVSTLAPASTPDSAPGSVPASAPTLTPASASTPASVSLSVPSSVSTLGPASTPYSASGSAPAPAPTLTPASNLIPTSTSASVLPPASASTPASISPSVPPSVSTLAPASTPDSAPGSVPASAPTMTPASNLIPTSTPAFVLTPASASTPASVSPSVPPSVSTLAPASTPDSASGPVTASAPTLTPASAPASTPDSAPSSTPVTTSSPATAPASMSGTDAADGPETASHSSGSSSASSPDAADAPGSDSGGPNSLFYRGV